jgi:folate-binding protein YgfZ
MNNSPLNPHHAEAGAQLGAVENEEEGTIMPRVYTDTATELSAACSGAGLIDLGHLGTISLEGPDARRFTNGMFTNNIRDLKPGECSRSAMCDDRGRILGLLDIYCTGDDSFEGVLEGVSTEWFESRYGMYIVFDDVEMTTHADGPRVLSLQGPEAGQVLAEAGLPVPDLGHHLLSESNIRVAAKDRSGIGGFDLIVGDKDLKETWLKLINSGATPIGYDALEGLRVRHGRARWPVDGTEKSMVHELGLRDEVCNFNKGCYLGQEVINRVDVKGQVTKQLHRIAITGSTQDALGAAVELDDKVVGTITSVAETPEGCMGLAVLRRAAWGADQAVEIVHAAGRMSGRVQALS